MTNKIIDKQSFIDCKNLDDNTATFDFNTKELKLGKATLSPPQIERIAFLLAYDLKTYANTGGTSINPTANEVYGHLQSNQ